MSFVGALHDALAIRHRGTAASAAHEVVAKALQRLDPVADVKSTAYFNHSFVPDLVVRWDEEDQRRERHVHLRFSVTTEAFEQDLDILGNESPLFLGMTDAGDLSHPPWGQHVAEMNGSLVTQGTAVAELDEAARTESRSRRATTPLVRVGRGLLDEPAAERVVNGYVGALGAIAELSADPGAARERVDFALGLFPQFLPEAGQLDVERALQSEWIKRGGDPFEFPSSSPWNPELLDVPSLREVLNSLLDSDQPIAPETWQRNAGFIRAEEIGRVLGRNLRGAKFNEMAHALLPYWTAKWAWAERGASPPLFESYDWLIDNGLLGLEAGDLTVFFADDGRHFKDKEGGHQLPRLAEAQQMLSQPGVLEVGLRGAMEGIRYEPLRASSSVYARIQEILSAPGARSYAVQAVRAVVPGTDWDADVDLDRQIIDLHGQSTPVAVLALMACRFFSRGGVVTQRLEHFLATGEPPAPEQQTVA
jgi:hypothetical protein